MLSAVVANAEVTITTAMHWIDIESAGMTVVSISGRLSGEGREIDGAALLVAEFASPIGSKDEIADTGLYLSEKFGPFAYIKTDGSEEGRFLVSFKSPGGRELHRIGLRLWRCEGPLRLSDLTIAVSTPTPAENAAIGPELPANFPRSLVPPKAIGHIALKICFVLMAHHQPRMFQKLLQHISSKNSDVVIHIDARSNINNFAVSGRGNVHFVTKRRKVHWTGWSQTETICEMLQHGLQVSDANYFILLAGTDFPIKRADIITRYLVDRYPANFLNYYPLVPGIWGYGHIEKYKLVDLKASLIDIRNPKNLDTPMDKTLLAGLVTDTEEALNAQLLPKDTNWTNLYSGSSRWCLNRETVRFVTNYFHSDKSRKLRNFLRFCSNSDEIFFQTAILNSPHKDQCTGFDEVAAMEIFRGKRPPMPDEKRVYFHYIDWSPEREDPAILVESDFQNLKRSDKFFACKFMDDKSLGLVEHIEREML
jgi:hypothetical protein